MQAALVLSLQLPSCYYAVSAFHRLGDCFYNYPLIIALYSVSHGQRRAPPCTRLKRVVFFVKKTTPLRIPQKKLF